MFPPSRIVCLTEETVETLYLLGEQDRIVGRGMGFLRGGRAKGDGESRVIGVGEVILVEDTTGKGHLSQHVEGKIRHSIFVPID